MSQDKLEVIIQRLPGPGSEFPLPSRASDQAAGYDLRAAINTELSPGAFRLIPTGIALALPPGWEAQIRPRSGLALKHGVTVLNAPGTIDADYRGEVGVILINHNEQNFQITTGLRIAQMVFSKVCQIRWKLGFELPPSHRGSGGFGSTGA